MLTKKPHGIAIEIVKSMSRKHPLEDGGAIDAMTPDMDDEEEGEDDEHLQLLASDAFDALHNDDHDGFVEALVTLVKSIGGR